MNSKKSSSQTSSKGFFGRKKHKSNIETTNSNYELPTPSFTFEITRNEKKHVCVNRDRKYFERAVHYLKENYPRNNFITIPMVQILDSLKEK